ncbi:aldose 1-epimerase [Lutimonas sp.]|uniref:aldose epimerase family protein n=1 Tax=Lutimonas sp. TaxID=1872403 RepID=UPI003D9B46DA
MVSQIVITSPDKESTVVIDDGELVSYSFFGEELIHQKGDRGWRNADTEMFPIIGPTEANNFRVQTDRGEAIQDQHGLLRELDYKVLTTASSSAEFSKSYKKNSKVKNSKFPEKSTEASLSWPYDFHFKKSFQLDDKSLLVSFEVDAEKGMPYMLGYHPAFKLSGNNTESLLVKGSGISLQDVLDVGSIAYKVLNTDEIVLNKPDGADLHLSTEGFHNFMLWTEVSSMLCIEPITAYPYTGSDSLAPELFLEPNKVSHFKINIRPNK